LKNVNYRFFFLFAFFFFLLFATTSPSLFFDIKNYKIPVFIFIIFLAEMLFEIKNTENMGGL